MHPGLSQGKAPAIILKTKKVTASKRFAPVVDFVVAAATSVQCPGRMSAKTPSENMEHIRQSKPEPGFGRGSNYLGCFLFARKGVKKAPSCL